MNPRGTLILAGAIAATAILAACSGTSAPASSSVAPSSSPSHRSGGAASSAVTASNQPAPRAAEVNPAGDIPDNQAFVAFSPTGGGYSVKIPEGWARTSLGATVAFTDKLNHIQVSMTVAPKQPTMASVTKNDVPLVTAKTARFTMGTVSAVARSGGSAILLTYQGDSAPDPVTGKVVRNAFERFTFYRSGKRIDLTLSGPTAADNVDPWRLVSDSLRLK